jgi:type I restriction enzyme S subunit
MELMPGYKRSDVGVIPEDWACEPLSQFFSFISYGFTNPMPTVHDGIFMITAADINDGRLQLETARRTSETAYRTLLSAKSRPRPNDILLTKDGTLGRLALVGDKIICINQSVAIIRPNERVEPQFLKLLLESPRYQKRMVEDAGGSTIKHIYITIVDKMPLGLPLDKAEQHAIAKALSDVETFLATLDQMIAKKRDLKQAAMQQLLTGQTRLPGFSGEWVGKRLEELCAMKSGEGITAKNIDSYSEYPCYGGNGLRGFTTHFTHDGNYCLIGRVGALCGNLVNVSGKFFASEHAIVVTALDGVDIGWLTLALGTLALNRRSESSAQPVLTVSKLRPLELLAPPTKEEQSAIARALAEMDAEISTFEARRDKTRNIKQAMMQELLTGKTRLA